MKKEYEYSVTCIDDDTNEALFSHRCKATDSIAARRDADEHNKEVIKAMVPGSTRRYVIIVVNGD